MGFLWAILSQTILNDVIVVAVKNIFDDTCSTIPQLLMYKQYNQWQLSICDYALNHSDNPEEWYHHRNTICVTVMLYDTFCLCDQFSCHMRTASINSIQSVMTVSLAKVLTNLNALHLMHYEYELIHLSIFEVYFKICTTKNKSSHTLK